MKIIRISLVSFLVAALILCLCPLAHTQQGIFESDNPVNFSQPTENSYLNLMIGLRKYFNSFTSWQLPSDNGPQNPISRLEYPWDQIFLAVRGSAACSGLEVNMEYSGTLSMFSSPKAQDSDWLIPSNPGQKSVFSESESKPRCWIFDTSFNVHFEPVSPIRPLAGYRISQFKFTNTDGYQFSLDPKFVLPLDGASIEFSQYYKQVYAGFIFKKSLTSRNLPEIVVDSPLFLRIQVDASYVIGDSHDEHLRRYAFGIIRSAGWGWHVNLMAGIKTGRFRLDAEGDIRGLRTNGEIESIMEDEDRPNVINRTFIDGAKAWSEQKYLGINGTLFF